MKIKRCGTTELNEMASLSIRRTQLPVVIWSEHNGKSRKTEHNETRVKIGNADFWATVSIEKTPRILARSSDIKISELNKIRAGMKYVGRNHDLFLKHWEDSDFLFDDEDLFNALRQRGEYL